MYKFQIWLQNVEMGTKILVNISIRDILFITNGKCVPRVCLPSGYFKNMKTILQLYLLDASYIEFLQERLYRTYL